jgi:hypothetical protein
MLNLQGLCRWRHGREDKHLQARERVGAWPGHEYPSWLPGLLHPWQRQRALLAYRVHVVWYLCLACAVVSIGEFIRGSPVACTLDSRNVRLQHALHAVHGVPAYNRVQMAQRTGFTAAMPCLAPAGAASAALTARHCMICT